MHDFLSKKNCSCADNAVIYLCVANVLRNIL